MFKMTDAAGRVYVEPGGTPVTWSAGLGFTAEGKLCTTTIGSPNKPMRGGIQVDDVGRMVVGAGGGAALPYIYNGGFPTDARSTNGGVVISQENQTPDPSDPFVNGVRVGPLGGVYMITAAIPVGDAPVNTVLPDTTGDAKVGSTLTTTQGTWTGTAPITYAYQWFSGRNPTGVTTNTYVVQASDVGNAVLCQVTATNAFGGSEATGPGIRIVFARYDYLTNAGVPMSGVVSAGSVSAPNQVRINDIDKDGNNHSGPMSRLRAGDSIFVGTQEGIIAVEPIEAEGYFIFDTVSWPALTNGTYNVTFGFNALFVANLDNDSFEDFPILQASGLTVTEDEDSYNIDFNGDGVADVVVPKP